jgi:hypothetical protein
MSDAVDMVAALSGGEQITYTPYGGTVKVFKAIIDREPSRVSLLTGVAYPEQALLLTFPNDAIDGVTSVAKGKDKVRFRKHLSDAMETEYTVVMVQEEDSGMVTSDDGMWTVLVK